MNNQLYATTGPQPGSAAPRRRHHWLRWTIVGVLALVVVAAVGVVAFVKLQPAPARLAEFIAGAKANPDKISFGTSGPASSPAMAVAQLNQAAGTSIVQVPYRGSGEAARAVAGGAIQGVLQGALVHQDAATVNRQGHDAEDGDRCHRKDDEHLATFEAPANVEQHLRTPSPYSTSRGRRWSQRWLGPSASWHRTGR